MNPTPTGEGSSGSAFILLMMMGSLDRDLDLVLLFLHREELGHGFFLLLCSLWVKNKAYRTVFQARL